MHAETVKLFTLFFCHLQVRKKSTFNFLLGVEEQEE